MDDLLFGIKDFLAPLTCANGFTYNFFTGLTDLAIGLSLIGYFYAAFKPTTGFAPGFDNLTKLSFFGPFLSFTGDDFLAVFTGITSFF